MASIKVEKLSDAEKDGKRTWDVTNITGETTAECKSALREVEPGEYRIIDEKWRGKVVPKDETILTKK